MERLSLYPTETLLAAPVPADQALRGVAALHALALDLAGRIAAIGADRARLAAERDAVAAATPALAAAEDAQQEAEAALDRQLAAATATRATAEAEEAAAARQAASLAAHAASLRDLLARLEAARRAAREAVARAEAAARAAARRAHAPPVITPPGAAPGAAPGAPPEPTGPIHLTRRTRAAHQLLRPVQGRLIRGWGAATPGGPATGLTWRTVPGAAIRAPCTGAVLFAAPFHGYGKLLIADCGGGYDAVLGGFATLDATPGQVLRAGRVLGALPDAGHAPTLYFELRHDGTAIDPAPWLRPG